MNTFLKIAWINIWRNKNRTLLTLSVLFISVFLAIVMTSKSVEGPFDKLSDRFSQYLPLPQDLLAPCPPTAVHRCWLRAYRLPAEPRRNRCIL